MLLEIQDERERAYSAYRFVQSNYQHILSHRVQVVRKVVRRKFHRFKNLKPASVLRGGKRRALLGDNYTVQSEQKPHSEFQS